MGKNEKKKPSVEDRDQSFAHEACGDKISTLEYFEEKIHKTRRKSGKSAARFFT